MSLRVSGKNMAIGESLRAHVEAKVGAAVGKYFDGGVTGHVTLEPEGSGYRADCTLHLSSGITIQAEGLAQEPYASFDQASTRIEKRLRRYKRRLKGHHADPGAGGAGPEPEALADYVIAAPDAETEEPHDFSPVIIAERTSRLRSLAVAEAVADLDLTGAPVVVFRHAGNGRLNVVYRRPDGHIGWLDPTGASA